MDGKRLRHQNDRGKEAEAKEDQRDAKNDRVPAPEKGEIDERVRAEQTPHCRYAQEKDTAEKQCIEQPGPPPVEALALIESGEQQGKACAAIEKSCKTRRRAVFWSGGTWRGAAINAPQHDRSQHRHAPKHPAE